MTKTVRRYEIFPSKNVFFLGGRLLGSRKRGWFYLAFSLLIILAVLFWAFPCREMIEPVSPAILVISIIGIMISFVSFVMSSFIDPGIIPRGTPPASEFDKPSPTKHVIVDGIQFTTKYCDTCNFYRPPRSTHCSECDNCVLRFDHHCPWLANCVGKRNYNFYLTFIFSLMLNSIYTSFWSGYWFVRLILNSKDSGGDALLDSLRTSPVSPVLCVLTAIVVLAMAKLVGFHIYLVCVNQTTNEQIKRTYRKARNPYFVGRAKNWFIQFCPPYFPSFFDFRELVEVDDGTATDLSVVSTKEKPAAK
eukprot:TRINITY_DN2009_c0_g1_i1.p1 TRINITY_DN2009_c0_g1~~TRINITY_DN2009_c0_g1_i1.p1  ORF type:complete len:305 (-),score=26.97 TRINITY_DN2009_c0_g1_i1:427-1341(-)